MPVPMSCLVVLPWEPRGRGVTRCEELSPPRSGEMALLVGLWWQEQQRHRAAASHTRLLGCLGDPLGPPDRQGQPHLSPGARLWPPRLRVP